jgi:DNA-binding transcriptional ArsR family regulator
MAESSTSIRNLLRAELGECCDEDVERRLENLDALAAEAFADDAAHPVFAVLGDETRYRLARALAVADQELCVCELDPLVDVSESAVSHALADLVDAGLVTRRKEGNWRYYDATALATSLFETADEGVTDIDASTDDGVTADE